MGGMNTSNLTRISCQPHLQELSQRFKVLYLNAQSRRNKTTELSDLIDESKANLVFLTETWLKDVGDEVKLQELVPPGLVIHSCPRKGRPAGGIEVLYRDTLHNCVTISSKEHGAESFESCETQVNYIDQSLTVLCLYRPPPSKKNQQKTTQFMSEFPGLLEDLATRYLKLVVLGDINLHFDSNSDPNVKSLKSLFPTLHLFQHISVPTHRRGHTLDWLIASEDISIQDIEGVEKLLSDHFVMLFSFNLRKPARATGNVSSRDIRRINLNAFKADVGALQLDSSDLLHSYNSGLREVLDQHAPLRHRRITDRPSHPGLQCRTRRRSIHEDVLNGAGENKSSSTNAKM